MGGRDRRECARVRAQASKARFAPTRDAGRCRSRRAWFVLRCRARARGVTMRLILPRFRGHPERREDAPGVFDGEEAGVNGAECWPLSIFLSATQSVPELTVCVPSSQTHSTVSPSLMVSSAGVYAKFVTLTVCVAAASPASTPASSAASGDTPIAVAARPCPAAGGPAALRRVGTARVDRTTCASQEAHSCTFAPPLQPPSSQGHAARGTGRANRPDDASYRERRRPARCSFVIAAVGGILQGHAATVGRTRSVAGVRPAVF